DRAVLAHRSFRVAGRLTPAVAGEQVVVRIYRGQRKLLAKAVKIDGKGRYRTRVSVARSATVTVRASHRATEKLGTARARTLHVDVLPRHVAAGQKGASVRMLQKHLAKRGYVVGRRGLFDARTAR